MLKRLTVSNFAIIDKADLTFDKGLTVITGETGAGKSIILGALDLILGERSSAEVLREQDKKCIVEGVFLVDKNLDPQFFSEQEIEFDPETIIRREISPGGKSRAFINDTPVNLAALKALTKQLVDIHRPYQTLDLTDSKFQTEMLDALCDHEELLQSYKNNLKSYNYLSNQVIALEKNAQAQLKELDFLNYQYSELEKASIKPGEQENLEEELKKLEHADEIKSQLMSVLSLLNENEFNAINSLKEILKTMQNTARLLPSLNILIERINPILPELLDISAEIESLNEKVNQDPERQLEVQQRIDVIYRLEKKHHVNHVEDLIDIQNNLQEQITALSNQNGNLEQLKGELITLESTMRRQCDQISKKRINTCPIFEQQINNLLSSIGLINGRLQITIQHKQNFSMQGMDMIEFLFSANKGGALRPIADIASVGEMSRLMLCIKSVVSNHIQLPTMIFDEIDTGISGQTAASVGGLLKELANAQQLITITHLPQIAAKGNKHYFVFKEDDEQSTYTRVKKLDPNERVAAIAQMLSGDKAGEAAFNNAHELLGY